jgi:integrase
MAKLTALKVQKTSAAGLHGDGGGLYLRVKDGGAKSWVFRFQIDGKSRSMGLGSFPAVSLTEAREAAADARKLTSRGEDPIEVRTAGGASAKRLTFDQACAAYVEAHKAGWKNPKTAKRWLATCETYASPVFGKRAVATITSDDVLRVLAPIWSTKNETAAKLRGRLEAVLDWATVKKYRTGANPALWRGNLKHLLPARAKVRTVKHFAALPWQELPAFMTGLKDRDALAARALEITILCATRTSETLQEGHSEIKGDLWVIPPSRMKMGREFRIPLAPQAVAIFASLPILLESEYIFPGHRRRRPLSGMAMEMLLRRMNWNTITVHGFRSTFRDWAAEKTDFQREIIELCLAHDISSDVERAYRRSDLLFKRRELLKQWADYCFSV